MLEDDHAEPCRQHTQERVEARVIGLRPALRHVVHDRADTCSSVRRIAQEPILRGHLAPRPVHGDFSSAVGAAPPSLVQDPLGMSLNPGGGRRGWRWGRKHTRKPSRPAAPRCLLHAIIPISGLKGDRCSWDIGSLGGRRCPEGRLTWRVAAVHSEHVGRDQFRLLTADAHES